MVTATSDTRSQDEIKAQAKEVWEAVTRHALSSKWKLVNRDGISGYEGEYVMRGLCEKIWPQYAGPGKRGELDALIQPIYSYLRNTGNAACVYNPVLSRMATQRGSMTNDLRETPVWFVAQRWNNNPPSSSPAISPARRAEYVNTHRPGDAHLAQSIGATIGGSVLQQIKTAIAKKDAVGKTEGIKQARSLAASIADYVEIILLEAEHPLVVEELLFALRAEKVQVSNWTLRQYLSDLVETGAVAVRTETLEERQRRIGTKTGRRAQLYTHGDHVPVRYAGDALASMVHSAARPRIFDEVETTLAERPATESNEELLKRIADIVDSEKAELKRRLAEAEAELAELRPLRDKLRDLLK